jgi:plastocyanin
VAQMERSVVMNRRPGGLLTALIVAAVVAHTGMLRAAGGTITGSVKILGAPSAADAVVYIEHADGTFPTDAKATMNQRSQEFVPRVLPIVDGTAVKFLNSDPTAHNVFSPDYEKYDLGTWQQGDTKEYAFPPCAKPPCAYTQLCKLHAQMEASIVVLQNPFFAVTAKTGHFEIDNVPPGSYTVATWYARRGRPYPVQRRAVTVDADGTASVDFVISR